MISECYRVQISYRIDGDLPINRYQEIENSAWRKIIQLRLKHDEAVIHDGSYSSTIKDNQVHLIFDKKQAAEDFHRELMGYFGKFTYLTVVEEA
ncbi:hypothetical protein GCM10023116_13440 [Kistimonas scapharcae]|uniref:Uncharacterized protein n=1 Tax=Kistimonas scapharcae TaxID=1036133 RepID=A0ABP8V1X1_9GAMM